MKKHANYGTLTADEAVAVDRFSMIGKRVQAAIDAYEGDDVIHCAIEIEPAWNIKDEPHVGIMFTSSVRRIVARARLEGWAFDIRPTPPAGWVPVEYDLNKHMLCPHCGEWAATYGEGPTGFNQKAQRAIDRPHPPILGSLCSSVTCDGMPIYSHWSRHSFGHWHCCGLRFWYDCGGFADGKWHHYRQSNVQARLF